MYSHLLTIFASGVTPVPLQTSIWNHASAESRIKARLDFSERRLQLAAKPRPTRICQRSGSFSQVTTMNMYLVGEAWSGIC